MSGKRFRIAALFLFVLGQAAVYAQSTKMYWTETNLSNSSRRRIAKANVNGTGAESIVDGLTLSGIYKGVAVDNTNGHVYLANKPDRKIERFNLDGSGRATLVTGVYPEGIALDLTNNKIYWCDYTYSDPKIMRADLDGTGSETIKDGLSDGCVLEAIALDVPNNKLYWAERMDKEIWQANLDGSGASKILSCCSKSVGTYGLAVFNGKLYWSNSSTTEKAIRRSDVDGSNQELVASGLDGPRYLAIDPVTQKIYFPDGSKICSINIDGSGLTTLVTGQSYPMGMALSTETVTPYIEVTAPNSGESWLVGSSQNITWDSSGTSGNVNIEYSTNNGSTWTDIAVTAPITGMVDTSTPDTGTYAWTVPNTPSANCLVRVKDTDGSPSDTSDTTFTISSVPTITVTSPNGGENWQVGSRYPITWMSSGAGTIVKIEYSTNNGSSYTTITGGTSNDGTYNWTIPDAPSTNCLVRITDSDSSPTDTSNAVFTISTPPHVTVTSPNGGENWYVGSSHNITWTSSGTSGNVNIEYSTNNGSTWTDITTTAPIPGPADLSTTDDGSYSWTIPDATSTTCLVRISDTDGDPTDTSNAVFTISTAPSLTVTSPNGGENWTVGANNNITWTSNGTSGNVKIEYTINLGTDWWTVVASTTDDGSYSWAIPSDPTTQCLIRISDTDGSPTDNSDAAFTIARPRDDLLGTWDGQGVYYRNSNTGSWTYLASPASKITAGDLDGDGIDDLIGIWPSQGGVWVFYSSTLQWALLSTTADWIAAGDMNGDGRCDLLGTWSGQGVYYLNPVTFTWHYLATPASKITTGDLDQDGVDDLIGIWPSQGGVWAFYSALGSWTLLSTSADWIDAGDMNGDGRCDLLGSWSGQGVYCLDTLMTVWTYLATPASQITCGDLDGDGIPDLIGIWPGQGGVWAYKSASGTWSLLSSTAQWIAAGRMRAAGSAPIPAGISTRSGPDLNGNYLDYRSIGPGGSHFTSAPSRQIVPGEKIDREKQKRIREAENKRVKDK